MSEDITVVDTISDETGESGSAEAASSDTESSYYAPTATQESESQEVTSVPTVVIEEGTTWADRIAAESNDDLSSRATSFDVIQLSTTGAFLAGAKRFGDAGIFAGADGGKWKFSVGDGSTYYMQWNGTSLTVSGDVLIATSSLQAGHLIETGWEVAVASDGKLYPTRINSVSATATAGIYTNTVTTHGAGNLRFFNMSDTVKVILTSCGSGGGGVNARSRIYRAAITPTTTSSATVTVANLSGTTELSSDAVKINATTLFCVHQLNSLVASGVLVTGLDTTITVNAATTLSSNARGVSCSYYSATQAVVFYQDNATNQLKAQAPTWSGTTVSAGSETVLSTETGNTYVLSSIRFGTSQYYLLVYQETSANDLLFRIVQFNGSTFSAGSAVTISGTSGFSNYQSMSTVSVDDTYATISYNDNGTAKVAVVSHSGTVGTLNSATSFGTAQSNVAVHSYSFGKYTHTLSFLSGATTLSTYAYDVDGTTITQLGSALSTTTSASGGSQAICGRWNPTTGMLFYSDTTSTVRYEMDSVTFANNYSSSFFGISQAQIAKNAYGPVVYLGYATIPASAGLSSGVIYYLDTDGQFSVYNVSQGRACFSISATTVAVK